MAWFIEKNHLFEIYLPIRCLCGKDLDQELRANVFRNIQARFSGWFANFNIITFPGGWVLPDGSLANEKNDVVRSYADDEEFDYYTDEVKKLAQFVADELTQDRVAITIDGKILFFSRSNPDDLCSHGQIVESKSTLPPIAIQSQKIKAIYTSLSTLGDIRDIQNLFCGILNYRHSRRRYIPCSNWPSSIKHVLVAEPHIIANKNRVKVSFVAEPHIIADNDGFKVIFVHIDEPRILLTIERLIIRRIYQDNPTFSGIFVFTNQPRNQWELVNAKISGAKNGNIKIRRIHVGKGERLRTAVERIALLDLSDSGESLSAVQIQELHEKAFDFV